MTKEEFEIVWARRSRIKTTALNALGLRAEPCNCEEDGCNGWAMTGGPLWLSRAFEWGTEDSADSTLIEIW